MKARMPADQNDRLRELIELEVLDTAPEKRFDDVVRLASRICEMPISLISLVDEDRQWFKANVGLGSDTTPVEQAICAHAILEDDYLEISDTQTDPRTADNPLVTGDEQLHFYAGAVLRSSKGHAIGTLCVLDNKPNRLSDLQRETLKVLARQVMAQLELTRALKEAEMLRLEVDHRVKNSPQSIASLTRVQANMAASEETREALELTRRRIDAIALLHEQLYKADNAGAIAMEDFLPRVAALLQLSAPQGVRVECEVPSLTLPSQQATAIGVIVNEFASNAFKHAFGNRDSGLIHFAITMDGPDCATLSCSDNGGGMDDPDAAGTGLGMRIIEASAQQLGGQAVTTTDCEGTRTAILIALSDAA